MKASLFNGIKISNSEGISWDKIILFGSKFLKIIKVNYFHGVKKILRVLKSIPEIVTLRLLILKNPKHFQSLRDHLEFLEVRKLWSSKQKYSETSLKACYILYRAFLRSKRQSYSKIQKGGWQLNEEKYLVRFK